ncbi:MAG: metal-dependent hydrolase [bacterium]
MPLPVGHSLMGYALHESVERKHSRFDWKTVLIFAIVANLPDIDFLPGFFAGDPNKYHHHYLSHSMAFAMFAGSFFGYFYAKWMKKSVLVYFLIFTGVCFSHLILDYFTLDTSEPKGLPMFWPVSSRYFYSQFSIFMSVHKIGDSATFISSLFVLHNLWVALWEIVVFIPVLTIIKLVKHSKKKWAFRLADEKSRY